MIGITETWWNDSHDWNTTIEGYKLIEKNRENKKVGRVAVYVKNTHSCTEMQEEESGCPIESIWINLVVAKNKRNLVVGVYY